MKTSRWLKIGAAALVAIAGYATMGMLLGPRLAEGRVRQFLTESEGLELAIESSRVNPFTLAATFQKVSLSTAQESLLTADEVSAGFTLGGLFRPGLSLHELAFKGADVTLEVTPGRAAGWSKWLERDSGNRPLEVRSLSVEDAGLRLIIAGETARILNFTGLALSGKNLSSNPDAPGRIRLVARHALGGSLTIAAGAGLNPMAASGSFGFDVANLNSLAPWLDGAPWEAAGELTVRGEFSLDAGGPTAFTLARLELAGQQIELKDLAGGRSLRLDGARLTDVDLDFAQRIFHAGQVTLDGGLLSVQSDPQEWLAGLPDSWIWRADRVQTSALGIDIAGAGGWRLGDVELKLTDYDSRSPTRSEFTLATNINQGGQLRADGWLAGAAHGLQANLEISALDLRPYASLLGLAPDRELGAGAADGKAILSISPDGAQLRGSGELHGVQIIDRASRQRLFAADLIGVDGVILQGPELNTTVELARLAGPELQLSLDPNGRMNPLALRGAHSALTINRLEIQDGALHFSDERFTPPVAIRADGVQGAIDGLAGGGMASLALDGRLNASARAKLTANWRLGQAPRQQRIDLRIDAIEGPLLEAYATRFAGRGIESGTLNLDLRYLFRGPRFAARQHLVFDNLRLGAPVEHEGPDLPLDLAVALLQDRDGRIELTVPTAAKLENPDFNPVSITGRSLAGFLADLEEAPFRALGAAVGDPSGELGTIAFDSGSAAITAAAALRLASLRDALEQRPAVGLRIAGGYSRELDRGALARQQVRLHVALATSAGPPGSGDPGPLAYADPKVQSVLDEFAGERLAGTRIAAIQGRFSDADRGGYYRALFEALVANEPITETALRKLARYRAQAVLRELANLAVPAERLRLDDPMEVAADDDRQVQMALGVAVMPVSG